MSGISRPDANHDARARPRLFLGSRARNPPPLPWFRDQRDLVSRLRDRRPRVRRRRPAAAAPPRVVDGRHLLHGVAHDRARALWIIFWQIVITAAFVAFGALDSWPGWLGLALTVVSCGGLARIVRDARATGRTFAAALDEGLGTGWGNTLNPDLVRPPHRFEWRRVILPFAPKRSGVERVRRIEYGDGDAGKRHRLDVYRNADARPGARRCCCRSTAAAGSIGNNEQQGLPLMYHLADARLGVRRDQLPALTEGDLA